MSRMDLSTEELFLRLGSTPRTRSIRAEQLFRKLREDEAVDIEALLQKAPQKINVKKRKKTPPKAAAE